MGKMRITENAVLALSILLLQEAHAEVISIPAPPMTVANCATDYYWANREGSNLAYCRQNLPPPPPPPPPAPSPPPPVCRYQMYAYGIHIGDMGQCTADGGCEGKGYLIYYGGSVVASQMWTGYMEYTELNALATAGIAASGYKAGAHKGTVLGNGNMMGVANYEVCR